MAAGPPGRSPGSGGAAAGGGRAVGTGCAELVLPLFSTNYHRQPTGSGRGPGRGGPPGVVRRTLREAVSRLLLVHLMAHSPDPRATVRRLEAAGVESPAAEAIAAAIVNFQSGLATKADLEAALAGARAEVAGVERRTTLTGVAIAGLLFSCLPYSPADRQWACGASAGLRGCSDRCRPGNRQNGVSGGCGLTIATVRDARPRGAGALRGVGVLRPVTVSAPARGKTQVLCRSTIPSLGRRREPRIPEKS